MATSSYATIAELSEYLPGPDVTTYQDIFTTLLGAASRLIDQETGTYFYDDGVYERFFNSQGLSNLDTGMHPFWAKSGTIASAPAASTTLTYTASTGQPGAPLVGDQFTLDTGSLQERVNVSAVSGTGPYTLTINSSTSTSSLGVSTTATSTQFAHANNTLATTMVLTLAYFENQPLAQWIQRVDGDGVTPPSNFYCWPQNRPPVGSSADPTARRPFYGIDLARIPLQNTTYLPAPIPGYFTWGLTAHWGWPQVPDDIKHLCLKLAVRAWQSRSTGWALVKGSPEVGVMSLRDQFDDWDHITLSNYTIWSQGI